MVLGDAMTDVITRMSGPPSAGSDTPAAITLRPGGSAANTAAWLGHLGEEVVFVGCVGDDAFGRDADAALRRHGVTPALAVRADAASGACVVLVEPGGERTMLPDSGANAHLCPEDLPREALRAAGHLHVSGYALMRAGSRAAAVEALRVAREADVDTSVDPASAAPLAAMGAEGFRHLVRGVDLILVTLDEAAALCGSRDPRSIASDLLRDHRQVVIKMGEGGAEWHGPDGGRAHAAAVAPRGAVVDSTGAGDAFAAAFLSARNAGAAPGEALARGCALAAEVVARAGARPWVSRRPPASRSRA